MAEGEGFEPPVPFRVQRFSRPPVSTAHTSLRGCLNYCTLMLARTRRYYCRVGSPRRARRKMKHDHCAVSGSPKDRTLQAFVSSADPKPAFEVKTNFCGATHSKTKSERAHPRCDLHH